MPKAKKLKSGSWRVQVSTGQKINGKYKYKSFTAPTKKEAEFLASEFLFKRKEKPAIDLTFAEACEKYIQSKSNILSPATIRGYRIMMNHAFPDISSYKLNKLSYGNAVQIQINSNAAKYSPKSIHNQKGFITAVFNFFNADTPTICVPPKQERHIAVPTKAEIEKILTLLKQAPKIECQCLLAITCSLRQSEIYGLKPGDINGNVIKIHGARVPNEKNDYVYKATPKSKAGNRNVYPPAYLAAKLNKIAEHKNQDEYLFDTTPTALLSGFKKLLKNNHMPAYTIHSLRHAFAALTHAKNIPDKYILEMGGWSSKDVLDKIYKYTFQEETQKAQQKINHYFDNIL